MGEKKAVWTVNVKDVCSRVQQRLQGGKKGGSEAFGASCTAVST